MRILILSSCCSTKDDAIPIELGSKIIEPMYYLAGQELLKDMIDRREHIFRDPQACVGNRITYAFDLYRNGHAYADLLEKDNHAKMKERLLSGDDIQWFFLSGGYGVIHALEKAKKYQATFSKSIAYQKKIPFTAKIWGEMLVQICDDIIRKLSPSQIYVFGSQDYTNFIKRTNFWSSSADVKMFESTGSSGPNWLSPKLNNLAVAILNNDLDAFDDKHPNKFYKQ
jgi:hypothetical protein